MDGDEAYEEKRIICGEEWHREEVKMSRTVAHVRNKNEVGIDLLCAEKKSVQVLLTLTYSISLQY